MRLTPAERCLPGFDEAAKGYGGVGDDELQHSVEFAIMEIGAGLSEVFEVGEDAGDSFNRVVWAGDMDGVGAQIDGYM